MYSFNGIIFEIVRTWVYQTEYANDIRNGITCIELRSTNRRYSITIEAEVLSSFIESDK